jgi:P2-related tail formation protein
MHDASLFADTLRAERLLTALASELRRVSVHDARAVHLRALALKGAVTRWAELAPDEAARHAVIGELAALRRQVESLSAEPAVAEWRAFAAAH